jgi:acyl dehydratase
VDGHEPNGQRYEAYARHWEDFLEGTTVETRGLTVTQAHVVQWAMLSGDWLPIHVDHEYAAGTEFGQVIAHGPLTLGLALGLVVQSGFFGDAVVAWLGMDEVRLPRPVRVDDTIRVLVEVVEQAPTRRPERGRIAASYDVRNQRDETVLTFTSGFLLHRQCADQSAAR